MSTREETPREETPRERLRREREERDAAKAYEWEQTGKIPDSADSGALEQLVWRNVRTGLVSDNLTERLLACLVLALHDVSEKIDTVAAEVERTGASLVAIEGRS